MMQERCCNVRLLGGLAMVALAGRVYNRIEKKSRFHFIIYFQYEELLLTYISFINCKVTGYNNVSSPSILSVISPPTDQLYGLQRAPTQQPRNAHDDVRHKKIMTNDVNQ